MKINRTRTVSSLQPDERDGHRPAVVTQFWGDKSVALRGTSKGPGKKLVITQADLPKPEWQVVNVRDIDETKLMCRNPKCKHSVMVHKEACIMPGCKCKSYMLEVPKPNLLALAATVNGRRLG